MERLLKTQNESHGETHFPQEIHLIVGSVFNTYKMTRIRNHPSFAP